MIKPAEAGRVINLVRHLAVIVEPLPVPATSPDPWDDFLLAIARTGRADYLVTGDKAGLLLLKRFGQTRIVTIRQFLNKRA